MRVTAPTSIVIGLALIAATGPARGSACPASPATCLADLSNANVLVNDIFRDALGRTAPQLPTFGSLYNAVPACGTIVSGGCGGAELAPYDCPGQYTCAAVANSYPAAATYLNALDRQFWNPCRLVDPSQLDTCPSSFSCISDQTPGNYIPWAGLVFDLGASANQLAVFPTNDHGPQPCETLEVTVYFTSNPASRDVIPNPSMSGADPSKWNRAVLRKVYTKGWVEVRPADPAGHAFCGDTASYSVEIDGMTLVFALPSGAQMRYASVIAGNDGLDFASCGFDSSEAEIDAVAGLTESGVGVCANDLTGLEAADQLAWASDKQALSWTPLNNATQFNVYRGVVMSPWSYDQTCLAQPGSPTVSDATVPSTSQVLFYLVSGKNSCGESLLGRDSHGAAIPNSSPCQ